MSDGPRQRGARAGADRGPGETRAGARRHQPRPQDVPATARLAHSQLDRLADASHVVAQSLGHRRTQVSRVAGPLTARGGGQFAALSS